MPNTAILKINSSLSNDARLAKISLICGAVVLHEKRGHVLYLGIIHFGWSLSLKSSMQGPVS